MKNILIFLILLPVFYCSFDLYADSIDNKLAALDANLSSETKSARKVDLLIEKSRVIMARDYTQSEAILIAAQQLANDIGYQAGQLQLNVNLSEIYTYYSADYFKAMQFSGSALLMAKDMGNKGTEMKMHQNISYIFSSLKEINKAVTYAQNAYSIAVQLDDVHALATLNTLLGGYYETLQDTSKMLHHYGEVLKYYKLDFSEESSLSFLSIAKYYSLKKDYNLASQFYEEALLMSKNSLNKKNYAIALSKTASFYLEKGKLELAYKHAQDGLKISDSLGYFSEKVNQLKVLAKVFEAQGDYKNATLTTNQYYGLRDSLFNEKISSQIFLFEEDFKSLLEENELKALKDKELANDLLMKNEQLKKNLLIGGLLFVILSALALYSRLRVTRKLNKKLLDQKSELERLSIVASDINNAVLILNQDYSIEWVNNGYLKMSGYSNSDVLGSNLFNLPHSHRLDQESTDYTKQMMLGRESFTHEYLSYKKTGESYWIEASITPSFDKVGNILKYIIVGADITEKKQAFTELNQSYNSARLLSDIGVGITAAKTVDDIVDLVYAKINDLLDASCFGIGLVNDEKRELNFVSFIENGKKYREVSCGLDETDKMGVIAMRNNKAFLINDFEKEYKDFLDQMPSAIAGNMTRSLMYIPMYSKGQPIGVLTVQSFEKNAYQDNHFNLAKNIANYMAIAIEKTLLYQGMEEEVAKRTTEIVKQKDELLQTYSNTKLLSEIGLDISSTLNFDDVFQVVHSKIGRLMDAEMFGIRIYHEESNQIEYNYEIESGELDPLGFMSMDDKNNYTVWCIENKSDIFIKDNEIEYVNYIDVFKVISGKAPRSLIFTPMIVEGKVVGVLTIQSMRVNAFERHHLDLLKSLGAYVGSALINGSLYSTLEQKVEVRTKDLAEKNKNITDSINYAKRIQKGILPSEKLMRTLLPKSFVYFQPKDIVSGDFYWMAEKNGKTFVAVVDCTGHGVPGAFMSIIGESLLEQAINEPAITQTYQILDFIQEGLQKLFEQETMTEGYHELFDGMDMSLIAINMHKKRLEYSGACNSLFKVHDNVVDRIRGDKHGISAADYGFKRPFKSEYVDFEAGDAFYIFSDGVPDQFGGPRTKKLGYKKTSEMLANISGLSVDKQRETLVEFMEEWQGDVEQTDDICLFGFKI